MMSNILLIFMLYMIPGLHGSGSIEFYDVGCYQRARDIETIHGIIATFRGLLPSCLPGGLFIHVQCDYQVCYCAYIDTGEINKKIGYLNRFLLSYSQMLDICPQDVSEQKDECTVGPIHYQCIPDKIKYKFDRGSNLCKKTTGCYGYNDINECEVACVPKIYDKCSFPMNRGKKCGNKTAVIRRYRHNPESGRCEPFPYRGCGGNANNYGKIWQCERSCVSQGTVNVTLLVDNSRRYLAEVPEWVVAAFNLNLENENEVNQRRFKLIEGHAVSVMYVGTEEIDSRALIIGDGAGVHVPQEEVERILLPPGEVCKLPNKTGPCRALFYRWFYNYEKSRCERFIYGGCLANGNNFRNFTHCHDFCGDVYNIGARSLRGPTPSAFVYRVPDTTGTTPSTVSSTEAEEEPSVLSQETTATATASTKDSSVNQIMISSRGGSGINPMNMTTQETR